MKIETRWTKVGLRPSASLWLSTRREAIKWVHLHEAASLRSIPCYPHVVYFVAGSCHGVVDVSLLPALW